MKKLLLLAALFLFKTIVFAQPPAMGGNGKMQAPPSIGHIYGKITDSTGKGISDVSVLLLQNRFDTASKKRKDVLLKGVTTKTNGEFSFEDLPVFGAFKLKISATGYKAIEQAI